MSQRNHREGYRPPSWGYRPTLRQSPRQNHREGYHPPSWGYRPTLRQSPAELSGGLSPSLVGLPPHTPPVASGIIGRATALPRGATAPHPTRMRSVVLRCLRSLLRALLRGTAGAISHCVTHCLIQLSFPRRQALRSDLQHLQAPLHERPLAEYPGAPHPWQSLGMFSPPVLCVDSLHRVSGIHTQDGGTSWIPSTAFRESTQILGLASPDAPAIWVRSTLPTHHPIGRATALPRGATAPHSASRQRNYREGCRPPSWGYRPTPHQTSALHPRTPSMARPFGSALYFRGFCSGFRAECP